ncbi:S-adenosylmethionine tRNA ribosyltransferase [Burkholderia ubonensis]|uniref:S-adenosylmethionine:tRNA ribosyltransferase-isomerase n=1 Tax=Burkholderia ubonensis TaxID=101571 RepID=UPI00075A939A|nr:S-adenosylmethionine:tRNA ribosyltransferase-isomerase [Burkholderia ubonensis]KWO82397.1 S-adenosylmethionine tRNA ribosyltransferase [Burkholderia ubonensis]
MKTEDFDFDLDWKAMPTDPVELRGGRRDGGRMIVLDRAASTIDHTFFSTISDYLRPGDLLVFNDSYMLSNTLSFKHGNESAHLIVYGHEPDGTNIVELRSSQPPRPGLRLISVDDSQLTCSLLSPEPDRLWRARFEPAEKLHCVLDRHGWRSDETIHLNPTYWRTTPQAYRSVYARKPGSLEIPSAGLHFSTEVLNLLADNGVEFAYITLHVGATEILAVRHISEEEVEDHQVRPEYFEVGAEAAAQINRARAERRRIVAVGTTVLRTLESLARNNEPNAPVQAQAGWTELYVYPGFEFKVVDGLLTNLHRPRSSHIVLTAAFAGKNLVMSSYAQILETGGYEFDMFGDSMLIL